jgi:hypothetical protein
MPLTPQEEQELAILEQEEAATQQAPQPQPQGGLTPEEEQELAFLEQEEARQAPQQQPQQQQQPAPQGGTLEQFKRNPEAQLGAMDRIRFSIEPLESNRRAFLVQKFGQENVFQDEDGNLFVNQQGTVRPVNTEGFSQADLAELAGTIPDILATTGGAVVGGLAGLPVGGAGAIPGAIAGGAAGGAIGSAGRQAVSAALGVPQVAGVGERATDIGLGATIGGVTGGIGKAAKPLVKKAFPGLSKKGAKLVKIAKRQAIPKTTIGQRIGGALAAQEEVISKIPVFGRSIRKQTEKQVGKIQSNLKKQVGDFFNIDSDKVKVGANVKDVVGKNIDAIKKEAGKLYDDVAEKGKNVFVDPEDLSKNFNNAIKELKLFDQAGKKAEFNAGLGMSKNEFDRLQNAVKPVMDFIQTKTDDAISANEVNALRKTLNEEIKEVGKMGFSDVKLVEIKNFFEDVAQDMLKSKSPKLANDWKQARQLWSQQFKLKDIAGKLRLDKRKGIDKIADESVVNEIFKNSVNVKEFKKLVDEKTFKEVGEQFMFDTLKKRTGTDKNIAAETLLKNIREKKNIFEQAVGKKKLKDITDNLEFLKSVNGTINPSGTGFFNLIKDPFIAGRGLLLQVGRQGARTGISLRKGAEPLVRTTLQAKERVETRGEGFKKPKRVK